VSAADAESNLRSARPMVRSNGRQLRPLREQRAVRRILFHSYHYPPIGGSGAKRPLTLSRYLPDVGYDPIVITGAGATADRWAPADETLLSKVPEGIERRRLPPSTYPETSSRWRARAERWLGLRSPWARWWVAQSVGLGLEAGAEADLVYVWMQPYESAEAGVELSRRLGLPWIADLGDPWALDEMMVYPTSLHRARELRRMRALLGTASAIVMNTPEAASRLVEAFPELGDRPVVAIPNGFDAADFDGPPPARTDSAFRLVHTGYLHTDLGLDHRRLRLVRRALGGSAARVDVLTRSHVYVLRAIEAVLERDPSAAEALEFHLAGLLTERDREIALKSPVVTVHGYLTHRASIHLIRSADLLFLPMHNLPPGVRATIVPGKTYEYLASETPVLAAVPDGDARDLLGEAGNAMLCRPDDVEGMARALLEALDRHRKGTPPRPPAHEVVERFDYRGLTVRLGGVFDEVLAQRRTRGALVG
jgi:glycosyltransferase involved in cell wall biosynthesis